MSSSGFSVRICLLTLSARLITQTAVGVVNELGTSMGPWYWLDGRSESSHCEFATFALKQRWIRIRCGNSSLLNSSIKRERSSEFISVMNQARRDPVNWILRGTDNRMTRAPKVQAFNCLHVLALSNFCLFNRLQDRPDLSWAVLGFFCIFVLLRVEFQATLKPRRFGSCVL